MSPLKRLLVVEDDALLLLFLIDDLAERGLEAVAASSARTGARRMAENIDALITDIELGDGPNGLALARLASQYRPGLPIVIVSGGVTPKPEDLPKGAIFIPKPYSIDRILSALEKQRVTRAA
ncbi:MULTISPECIES: response regulator [unclassified Devosia]|uniref:response regulator n=1 Tax=unclassified Devosia TaxID=196773 RepID=UPI00145CAECF|nr:MULTISPECIES: response regulator [unclassified Devosia]MBJ6986742.1 response regulator [Devosia sp. MC521]MBJ7576891.1 response regulator [Devosia sp. MC532]MBK1793879.1 response regulator [Devosia sp. WQ 349K1]QMW61774.1 response regulator [Devosia sp. MC521]